jgi:hypothetical protein
MYEFPIEFVGDPEDESVPMLKRETVRKILGKLSGICSGEGCHLDPKGEDPEGEFCFRGRCKSKDRIFRVRDFEGKRTVKGERTEDDGGPGRGGFDLLGKYTLEGSIVAIYVDSCRKVALEYGDRSWKLEELIEVVLIHELAHLTTHRVHDLKYYHENDDCVHLWEYIAQCATYAYLKIHKEPEKLKVFEDLSLHQPFIYQTWEVLKAVESVQSQWCGGAQSTEQIAEVVKSIFTALKQPAPTHEELVTCYHTSDEGGD